MRNLEHIPVQIFRAPDLGGSSPIRTGHSIEEFANSMPDNKCRQIAQSVAAHINSIPQHKRPIANKTRLFLTMYFLVSDASFDLEMLAKSAGMPSYKVQDEINFGIDGDEEKLENFAERIRNGMRSRNGSKVPSQELKKLIVDGNTQPIPSDLALFVPDILKEIPNTQVGNAARLYIQGSTYQEIAQNLDLSVIRVKKYIREYEAAVRPHLTALGFVKISHFETRNHRLEEAAEDGTLAVFSFLDADFTTHQAFDDYTKKKERRQKYCTENAMPQDLPNLIAEILKEMPYGYLKQIVLASAQGLSDAEVSRQVGRSNISSEAYDRARYEIEPYLEAYGFFRLFRIPQKYEGELAIAASHNRFPTFTLLNKRYTTKRAEREYRDAHTKKEINIGNFIARCNRLLGPKEQRTPDQLKILAPILIDTFLQGRQAKAARLSLSGLSWDELTKALELKEKKVAVNYIHDARAVLRPILKKLGFSRIFDYYKIYGQSFYAKIAHGRVDSEEFLYEKYTTEHAVKNPKYQRQPKNAERNELSDNIVFLGKKPGKPRAEVDIARERRQYTLSILPPKEDLMSSDEVLDYIERYNDFFHFAPTAQEFFDLVTANRDVPYSVLRKQFEEGRDGNAGPSISKGKRKIDQALENCGIFESGRFGEELRNAASKGRLPKMELFGQNYVRLQDVKWFVPRMRSGYDTASARLEEIINSQS